MKKLIDFSEKAIEILDFVKEAEGHKTFSAVLHSVIAGYYGKVYHSKYGTKGARVADPAEKTPWERMTVEQYCESVGGTVDSSAGVCVIPIQGAEHMKRRISLTMPEKFVQKSL